MKLPFRNSEYACCSSVFVFITIGPRQAIGSSRGLPETSRKRIPSSPASTTTSSPRSNSTSDRFPIESTVSSAPSAVTRSVTTDRGSEAWRKEPEPAKT